MIYHHGANDDDSWVSPSAHRLTDTTGPRDDEHMTHDYVDYPCYGCGSSFESAAELVSHLQDVHGAS